MSAVAALLAVVAFAVFGRTAERHRRPGAGPLTSQRVAGRRAVAWLSLAMSLAASVAARGWAIGPVTWAGMVMLAAGVVFVALNLLPGAASSQR